MKRRRVRIVLEPRPERRAALVDRTLTVAPVAGPGPGPVIWVQATCSENETFAVTQPGVLLSLGCPCPGRAHPVGRSGLTIDLSTAQVWMHGEPTPVTAKEFLALRALARRHGALLSKDQLAAAVWPEFDGAVGDNNVEQVVARLRRKVEDDPAHPTRLLTVRGLGYRLVSWSPRRTPAVSRRPHLRLLPACRAPGADTAS